MAIVAARALAPRSSCKVLSRIAGRGRWQVDEILNQPRKAAAMELAMRREPGVTRAEVNPVTGRVLIVWNPDFTAFVAELALKRARMVEPLTIEGTAALQKENRREMRGGRLIGKMVLGGVKLSLILLNRLIWGPVAISPLGGTVAVLSLAATAITGYDFLRAFWRTVTGQSGITTGTLIGAATLSSIALRENVTALIVLWLLNLGEYLEMLTLRRTRRAIRGLLSTDDEEIWLLIDGTELSVSSSVVQPGDLVVVHAGRKIAVDGDVEQGTGTVNEAPITGESMPVIRRVGDLVYAGSILLAGRLQIRVTSVGAETVVGRLIQRVEQAHALRPRIQKVGDAFAKKVVPSSFAAAILVLIITRDPRRALTMLLVACPCAAGLATPTAVSASIGNSARRGILIKGGTHLETMAAVDTVCFDKTGTLTESHPTVQRVLPSSSAYSESAVLKLAARAERGSQHPLALAIVESAPELNTDFSSDDEFEILAGRGVRCWNWESSVLVGNARLMEEFGVSIPKHLESFSLQCAKDGETSVYVAEGLTLAGVIGIFAPVRSQAIEAVRALSDAGINRFVMLTGDSEPLAASVAAQVGVGEWRSRLLPQDKFDAIQELRDQGRSVAMVGDGINDAPALALADVGIAMGTAGSDVAIETADIALAADDLRNVATTLRISRHTMRIIRQNYALALGTNSIGLYLAAMGSINPIIAAVLHNLSTILVVANSSRLIQFDPYAAGTGSPSSKQSAADYATHTESRTRQEGGLNKQAA